jgi:uncharacterized alpha-E superfamily protein
MLSRVAESLYWMARYIERAETIGRRLDVNFHALLDADLPDHGDAWRRLLLAGGNDDLFREHFDDYTAQAVTEFLLWHPRNPNSVVACVTAARENARSVREQISSEMWEQLNDLYLFVAGVRPEAVLRGPHAFFVRVREGSHALQGVMRATLPRGEAYDFLELGAHLERADVTARVLAIDFPSVAALPTGSTLAISRLTALLKSCGVYEAFRRAERSQFDAERVLGYVLLERASPRTVLFCLNACLDSLASISQGSGDPARVLGRLAAELSFLDVSELRDGQFEPLLARVLRDIDGAGSEVATAYFTTRVIVPGPYAQAQQQQ